MLALFVGVLLLVSLFFNCLGVVSLYRFPDIYTRLHGATKCSTFGTLFAIFGLLLYSFVRFMAEGEKRFLVLFIHVVIGGVVLLISNPTGAHALARATHRSGILPEPAVVDALEEADKRKKEVTA
jgi:multicomponent Na+:H+ antiporter subunit G